MAHSAPTTRPSGLPAGPEEPSIGSLVQSAMADVSTLIRSEVELAKAEISSSVKRGGIGAGSFAAAGVFLAVAAFFFAFFVAELLALWVPRWAAFLIVTGGLVLLAGVVGFIGYRFFKRIQKPARTIETLKDLPDVMRREAPGQRQHDLPVVRDGHIERAAPHARLG